MVVDPESAGECLGEGICWCSNGLEHLREAALDRKYPGRCQEANGPDVPAPLERYCVLPAGHVEPHCGALDRPGDPCHWCGRPTPLDPSESCGNCWTSMDGMPLADLKALFADIDLSVEVRDV